MNVTLTETSVVDGAVDIIIDLTWLLEFLAQSDILFAFALPNHKDLQYLDIHLMKSLRQRLAVVRLSEDEAGEGMRRASSKVAR